MGRLRRVWHADRGRLLLRTPGPVPMGLAYVLIVETNLFPILSLFYRTMLFEYPSVLSRVCFHLRMNKSSVVEKVNISKQPVITKMRNGYKTIKVN